MSEVKLKFSDRSSSGFSYCFIESDKKIGKSHITINGDEALIADIEVCELVVRRFSYQPFFKRTISYRNQGYGTALITASINKCRDKQIKVIRGVMHGDIDRLTIWYLRHGFEVHGNNITLYL